MRSVHPMFPVKNVVKTMSFYKEELGFDEMIVWGDPPFYSIVRRGEVYIDFIESQSNSGDEGDMGGAYIQVDNVDEIYEELVAKNVKLLGKPENKAYGMRDFIALDVDGHRLCIGCAIKT